jgi:phosphoserine phosphatase
VNAYDFDKTIFYPDSSACFFRFCLKRHPAAVLRVLPRAVPMALRYRAGKLGARELKQQLFSFLRDIRNVEQLVDTFWEENYSRIGAWYLQQKRDDDVIVSASPEFLLRPAAERLGVNLIATPMDPYSGRILGRNCHDEEKLRRFREEYPDADIDCFYSDSLSDAPLASIAAHAILVKGDRLLPWPQ